VACWPPKPTPYPQGAGKGPILGCSYHRPCAKRTPEGRTAAAFRLQLHSGSLPLCFSLIVPSRPKTLSLGIQNQLLTSFGVTSSQVRILVAGAGKPRPFHLYVAHVQARFLDKLDFPSQEPAVDSGLDIGHWHIAAEPFRTLPHRLCRALRPGRYQETHAGNLSESWARATRKRKQGGASDKRRYTAKRKQL